MGPRWAMRVVRGNGTKKMMKGNGAKRLIRGNGANGA